MDTPVSELITSNEIIFGLVIGVSIIAIMHGFPVLAEKSADVICAATQKVSKQIIKAFDNRRKHHATQIYARRHNRMDEVR